MLKTINDDNISFTYYIPETKGDDGKLKGRTSDSGDNNKSSEIKVLPNPAHDIVLFSYPSDSVYTLQLFDIHGHKMLNKKLPLTGQFYLDLSNISAGLYFYHLDNENGKTEIGKLVIQK